MFFLTEFRDDHYTPIPELHYGIREASIIWAPGIAVTEHNMRVRGKRGEKRVLHHIIPSVYLKALLHNGISVSVCTRGVTVYRFLSF